MVLVCRNIPFGVSEVELASLFQDSAGNTVTNIEFVPQQVNIPRGGQSQHDPEPIPTAPP